MKGRVFDGQSLHENWIVRIDSITGKIVASGESGSIEEKRGQKIIEQLDTTILPGLMKAITYL